MLTPEHVAFGKAALQLRFIDEARLEEAFRHYEDFLESGLTLRFEVMLVERGYLTPDQAGKVREKLAHAPAGPAPAAIAAPARPPTPPRTQPPRSPITCAVCLQPNPAGRRECEICGHDLSRAIAAAAPEKATSAAAREAADASVAEDSLFGNLALSLGYIIELQLDECLTLQGRMRSKGVDSKIGEILLRKGYLTPGQVERVLSNQALMRGDVTLRDNTPMPRPRGPAAHPIRFIFPKVSTPKVVSRHFPLVARFHFLDSLASAAIGLGGTALALFVLYLIIAGVVDWNSGTPSSSTVDRAQAGRNALAAAEEAGKGESADLDEMIQGYRRVVTEYGDTPSGAEARDRLAPLEALDRRTAKEFEETRRRAQNFIKQKQPEKAFEAWQAYVEKMEAERGRPRLREATGERDAILASCREAIEAVLVRARASLERDDLAEVTEILGDLRKSALLPFLPEVAAEIEALDEGVAEVRRRETDRQESEKKVAEARVAAEQLTRDEKFCQAVDRLLAVLPARSAEERARAEEEVGPLRERCFKTWEARAEAAEAANRPAEAARDLRAALCAVRDKDRILSTNARIERLRLEGPAKFAGEIEEVSNLVRNGSFDKASTRLKTMSDSPPLPSLKELLGAFLKDIDSLRRNPSARTAVVDGWKAKITGLAWDLGDRADIRPEKACPLCKGQGLEGCQTCFGRNVVEGHCTGCSGTGRVSCTTCTGVGQVECPTCKGFGYMDKWETYSDRCSLCNGRGYYQGLSCRGCGGTGVQRKKRKIGTAECTACSGRKTVDCQECEEGKTACPTCKGTTSATCPTCGGTGRQACLPCKGSGRKGGCAPGCGCSACR